MSATVVGAWSLGGDDGAQFDGMWLYCSANTNPCPRAFHEAEMTRSATGDLSTTRSAVANVTGELLFVLLPLIVIAIIRVNAGSSMRELLSVPEWSFGTAVLMGQALVKLVSGVAAQQPTARWQLVALIVSAMVVLGLVPSLIVLSLMLTIASPGGALVGLQIALFLSGVVVFCVIGALGQTLLSAGSAGQRSE